MARTQLREIKAGETGHGILVENDGFISADLGDNKALCESVSGEGGWNVPNPLVFDCVFQKCEIENGNKRIYPRKVLEREIANYQKRIADGRGYGECYTPDVLCLTAEGWKPLHEVKVGDKVISLNTETKEIELAIVTNKISRNHDGSMIRIKGNGINDLVTPGHKFPVFDRNGNFDAFYSANDMMEGNVRSMSHESLLKTGTWTEKGDGVITLPGIKNPSIMTLKSYPNCNEDIQIPMGSFMKLMGIYLSEGDFSKNGYAVRIYQKKPEICALIEELIEELPFDHYTVNISKTGEKTYRIMDPRLHEYVKPLGNCYTKYIPRYLKQQSKENLRLLYDWFVLGDGRVRGDKRRGKKGLSDDVFSSSKQLILDLNELQLKIGYCGSYHVEQRDNDRLIGDRLIEGKNCVPMHFSLRSLSTSIYLDQRFISIEEEQYKGEVQCIDLDKNHTWYVMSNGKSHWTGNCNHPNEVVIDLSRICLNVEELHWEKNTVVGKVRIITSEGFRKNGIISCQGDQVANLVLSGLKVGVSSRGIGSIKQFMGKTIVQDDFELVCFDAVSDPSTPNAWICTSGKEGEKNMYIETKQTTKQNIDEQVEKLASLLD